MRLLGSSRKLNNVVALLGGLHQRLDRIEQLQETIMATLADLQAAVARDTAVDQSAITLLNGLSAKLQELVNAGADPAAFQKLADDLAATTDALAAAVTANTPAATPPVE